MADNSTALTALLGLVAVAGYQNRDKIGAFVKGMTASSSGGVGGLINHLTNGGLGDVAKTWVGTGANAAVTGDQLQKAIGPDVLATLSKQTGLSADQLLARLTQTLPQVVDGLTPNGKLPA